MCRKRTQTELQNAFINKPYTHCNNLIITKSVSTANPDSAPPTLATYEQLTHISHAVAATIHINYNT